MCIWKVNKITLKKFYYCYEEMFPEIVKFKKKAKIGS